MSLQINVTVGYEVLRCGYEWRIKIEPGMSATISIDKQPFGRIIRGEGRKNKKKRNKRGLK